MQRVNKIVGSGSLKGKRRWGKLRILATVLIQSAVVVLGPLHGFLCKRFPSRKHAASCGLMAVSTRIPARARLSRVDLMSTVGARAAGRVFGPGGSGGRIAADGGGDRREPFLGST